MLRRIVSLVVDAQDQGDVRVGGRGADDDFFRPAGLDVLEEIRPFGPFARGFHHDVDAQVLPGEAGDVLLGEDLDPAAFEDDGVALDRDVMIEGSENGIVFQKMGQRRRVGDVVHRQEFDLGVIFGGAQEIPADAPEAVDSDLDGHGENLQSWFGLADQKVKVKLA